MRKNPFLDTLKYLVAATAMTLLVIGSGRAAEAQRIEDYYGLGELSYVYEVWVPGTLTGNGKIVLRSNNDELDVVLTDMKVEILQIGEDGTDWFERVTGEVGDKILGAGSRLELPLSKSGAQFLMGMNRVLTVSHSGIGYTVNYASSCFESISMDDENEMYGEGFACRYVPGSLGEYEAIKIGEYVPEDIADQVRDYEEEGENSSGDDRGDDIEGENDGEENHDDSEGANDETEEDSDRDEEAIEDELAPESAEVGGDDSMDKDSDESNGNECVLKDGAPEVNESWEEKETESQREEAAEQEQAKADIGEGGAIGSLVADGEGGIGGGGVSDTDEGLGLVNFGRISEEGVASVVENTINDERAIISLEEPRVAIEEEDVVKNTDTDNANVWMKHFLIWGAVITGAIIGIVKLKKIAEKPNSKLKTANS